MKLRWKLLMCFLLVLFAAASMLAVLSSLGVLGKTEPAAVQAPMYELRLWQGRIGVFSPPGAEEPQSVTEVLVRGLPLTDRLALTKGVTAPDREGLVRLLEDYSA